MAIEPLTSYPEIPWWRRIVRWLCGGQDLVVVVATQMSADGTVTTSTTWLAGVDARRPIAYDPKDATTVTIEPLPVDTGETK
jgi:hypothetical protein